MVLPALLAAGTGVAFGLRLLGIRKAAGVTPMANGDASVVVVVDGAVVEGTDAPVGPSAFLKGLPPGPYTVARTLNRARIVGWELHRRRLAHGLQEMSEELGMGEGYSLSEEEVGSLVLPSVATAVREYRKRLPPGSEDEIMVTILLGAGKRVTVHVVRAPGAAVAGGWPGAAVDVVVAGPGRTRPGVKNSQWITDRGKLESSKPKWCKEVVLSDASGGLLEGMVTNFFVIRASTNGRKSMGEDADGACVLETAAAGDGVLPGTVRQLVLDACGRLGIGVVLAPPAPARSFLWREAFICNAVSILEPVKKVHFPRGPGGGGGKADVVLPGGRVAGQIRREVMDLMAEQGLSPEL